MNNVHFGTIIKCCPLLHLDKHFYNISSHDITEPVSHPCNLSNKYLQIFQHSARYPLLDKSAGCQGLLA